MKPSEILLNTQYEFNDTLTFTDDEIGDDHIDPRITRKTRGERLLVEQAEPVGLILLPGDVRRLIAVPAIEDQRGMPRRQIVQ